MAAHVQRHCCGRVTIDPETLLQEVKLQNNMKDEEIKSLRDRMIKMESIIPVQVRHMTLGFTNTWLTV